jgi:hypothetical protein
MASLELAGGGLAETLGRRPVGFDLGHCNVLDGVLSLTRAVACATLSVHALACL